MYVPGVGGHPEVPEVVVAEDEADELAGDEGDGQADLVAGQVVPHRVLHRRVGLVESRHRVCVCSDLFLR